MKTKFKNKVIDTIIIVVVALCLALVSVLIFSGCAPGQLTGTGYLVTVTEGIKTDWEKLENTAQVDSFVFAATGLTMQADSLIHPRYPFYQFRNGIFDIYVEKKGVYQRRENGKRRWKIYDEKLLNQ